MKPYFLLSILFWISILGISQSTRPPVSKSPQEILTERAEYYFKIGDYFRANNLYKYCLTALVYVENEEEVRNKLNICKQLHYLQNQLFYAITKGDNNLIQTLSNKILKLNPEDNIAKMSKGVQYDIVIGTGITPSQKAVAMKKANELNQKGKKNEALAILEPFKGDKEVERIKEAIKKGGSKPVDEVNEDQCDKEAYNRLKREMEKEYASCHLEDAKAKARLIKKINCYSNDPITNKVLENINDIQTALRNISGWRSGEDNSKRDFVIPEYERIFKKNKNCVEWDYFYYVYLSAEKMRANSPCNKEIIARLLTAQRISPNLAQKEDIAQKIASIENCIDCEGKISLFVTLFNSAKNQYRRCQYDEAIGLYQEAQKLLSSCTSSKVEQLTKEWDDIKGEIAINRRITTRFNWLKSAADSLRALDQCEVAHKYYLEADSLQTKCSALVKTDLATKIAISNCCRLNQKFDNFIDSSRRAQRLNLFRDGLRFADSALVVGMYNPDCISAQKIKSLEDYLCLTYKKGCPVVVALDTTIYRGFEITGGTFYNNPTLKSPVRTNLPSWYWGGWAGGVNYIIGDKYGELKISGQFSQNYFKIQNQFAANEEFDFQLIKAGLEASIRLKKKTKTYPFVTIGAFGNFPLSFNYKSTLNSNSVKGVSYLSGGLGFKAGLGIAIRSKITLSLVYDRVTIIDNGVFEANLGPLFLEKSIYQTLGVNVSYRMVKMVNKNKAVPVSKR